ncbi:DUF636 domain-containing protein [Coprinellus micaceus]|uniref:DUF636 domain-containing protein n=1 Tax=Coprinellus micaceus TaxID=71717 RepID=A0A4Y7TFY1_COPMI|nr:DUF636 domain-containing protein [Coprinellus micaceus]
MATYQASCLCQAVNFELTGEPFRFAVCHCHNCKVAGGGAFMTNAFFKSQNMKVTKGLDRIKTYRDSNTKTGNALLRSFCSNCGSNVFLVPEAGGLAIVQAATVGGSENWVPTHESYHGAKWNWVRDLEFQPRSQSPSCRASINGLAIIRD